MKDHVYAVVGLLLVVFASSIVAAIESLGALALFACAGALLSLALLFREVK